jgi:hypothetical protein
MTVEAIVGDEELSAGSNRFLIALIGIPDCNRLDAGRKSGREILGMFHKP